MNTHAEHGPLPMILPWLARKAGISDRRAEVLWRAAQRHAASRRPAATPEYWQMAMDRLLELVAAEALRADAASFGWRPWSRLQARAWELPVALLDCLALGSARGWRIFGQSLGRC